MLPDLPHEADGDLHTILRGLFQQHHEQLQRQQLVRHLLVHQVRDELGQRRGLHLVPPSIRPAEAVHHSLEHQLSGLRQLGVHHRQNGGVDVTESGRRHLRLEQRAREEPSSAHQIHREQLRHDLLDVAQVDAVDESVYGFAQLLPAASLVLLTALVHHCAAGLLLLAKASELVWRKVHTSVLALARSLQHLSRVGLAAASLRHTTLRLH
mmetsp:Transcript_14108/g.52966  ORF Transcript_14108/g.52966 Transcript_14108/m.52966 type:complete len:210 (+) Transcript_14108:3027-3656(+)